MTCLDFLKCSFLSEHGFLLSFSKKILFKVICFSTVAFLLPRYAMPIVVHRVRLRHQLVGNTIAARRTHTHRETDTHTHPIQSFSMAKTYTRNAHQAHTRDALKNCTIF